MPGVQMRASVPFGVLFIFLSISLTTPNDRTLITIFFWLLAPALIYIGYVIWKPPRYLSPNWINQLVDKYGYELTWEMINYTMVKFANDSKKIDQWEYRVSKEEGLMSWAEETRKALGYPPLSGEGENL